MISCVEPRCGSRAQQRRREAEMTEPGAVLEAAHTAISDLAAVLVAVRSGLGGECVRAGSHLEMGEIDLLSARDAVEKARLEIDLAGPTVADVRVTVPLSVGSVVLSSAAPESMPGIAGADVRFRLPSRRRAGPRRHGFPGHGQGELFSVHDVTSGTVQLA
jgi:hypothetical protein